MRHVVFLDLKITQAAFDRWKAEDILFWKAIGIKPQYWVIRQDFSDYPVEPDADGDARPTRAFMRKLTDDVHAKYQRDGTDFVMLLVHEKNWKSSGPLFEEFKKKHGIVKPRGIWGFNLSNVFHNYHLQYCRWASRNHANIFGTIYHERHHALDALIRTETGVNVNPLINVKSWDSGCTHGEEKPWHFIRHKENIKSLEAIAPHLKQALKRRQDRHNDVVRGKKQTIVTLLQRVVYLYRQKLNRKNGVKNGVKNN